MSYIDYLVFNESDHWDRNFYHQLGEYWNPTPHSYSTANARLEVYLPTSNFGNYEFKVEMWQCTSLDTSSCNWHMVSSVVCYDSSVSSYHYTPWQPVWCSSCNGSSNPCHNHLKCVGSLSVGAAQCCVDTEIRYHQYIYYKKS